MVCTCTCTCARTRRIRLMEVLSDEMLVMSSISPLLQTDPFKRLLPPFLFSYLLFLLLSSLVDLLLLVSISFFSIHHHSSSFFFISSKQLPSCGRGRRTCRPWQRPRSLESNSQHGEAIEACTECCHAMPFQITSRGAQCEELRVEECRRRVSDVNFIEGLYLLMRKKTHLIQQTRTREE